MLLQVHELLSQTAPEAGQRLAREKLEWAHAVAQGPSMFFLDSNVCEIQDSWTTKCKLIEKQLQRAARRQLHRHPVHACMSERDHTPFREDASVATFHSRWCERRLQFHVRLQLRMQLTFGVCACFQPAGAITAPVPRWHQLPPAAGHAEPASAPPTPTSPEHTAHTEAQTAPRRTALMVGPATQW